MIAEGEEIPPPSSFEQVRTAHRDGMAAAVRQGKRKRVAFQPKRPRPKNIKTRLLPVFGQERSSTLAIPLLPLGKSPALVE